MKLSSVAATGVWWAVITATFQLANSTSQTHLERFLSSMSQSQKIFQMAQIDISMLFTNNEIDQKKIEHFFGELGIGSLLVTPYQENYFTADFYRSVMIQIQNVTKTYNNPPVIAGIDSVHGANYIKGAAIFPQPINIASTWEKNYAKSAGMFGARETVAAGINWLFSPIVGLGIEPLWARMYETFGEDPYLVGIFASEMVKGIQASGAAACGKHFVGYSVPRSGHDRSPSWIPVRHLYQYFVRPWREVIKNGKPMTIMESYTEYDGVPNIANRDSLVTLLRQDLGFNGVLVTDYQEIENLVGFHKVAIDIDEAVKLTLTETSVDMSMIPFYLDGWMNGVVASLNDDSIQDDRIDRSLMRILSLKEDLGMFTNELSETSDEIKNIGSSSRREVALKIARESIVLTKNIEETLPLPTKKLKIHVTGPISNSIRYQTGGWTVQWQGAPSDEFFQYGQTVLQAANERSNWEVTSSCGVNIMGDPCDGDSAEIANQERNAADYIIVCIGEENYTEKPGDIRDLSLPRGQTEFVQSLKASSNAKIIAVYFGGRPRLLGDIVQNADSILIAFLPGPDGGKAVIDLITGDYNPTGRLPITYPKYQDGGGIPYWHSVSDLCTSGNPHEPLPHWAYTQCEIEWPFGHGLSYTTFAYSNLRVSSNIVHHGLPWDIKGDNITVSVDVKNTGKIAGSDAVMFFIFEESRHVTPEYKRLLSFERRTLAPGKKETVAMTLTSEALRHIGPNDDKHDILQIGQRFRIGIGSATDCRNRPNENGLCTEELTLELAGKGASYSPVCETACILLRDKKCLSQRKISASDCYSMCQSSSSPTRTDSSGWGWNYLNCIEPILLDSLGQDPILLESLRQDGSKCFEMDKMCRCVLKPEVGEDTNIDQSGDTANIDQSGGIANIDQSGIKYITIIVSMFAGVIGTLVMLYPFYKHAFQNRMPRSDYKEIEFTSVGQDEDDFHIS